MPARVGPCWLDIDAAALGSLPKTDLLYHRGCDLADPAALDAVLEEAIPRGVRVDLVVTAVGLIWNEPALAQGRPPCCAQARKLRTSGSRQSHDDLRDIDAHCREDGLPGGGVIVNFSSIAARQRAR